MAVREKRARAPVRAGQDGCGRREETDTCYEDSASGLDLAKVEAGHLTVDHAPALAGDTTTAALALVEPQALQKGIGIDAPSGDKGAVAYVGDEDRVRQILVNLLSNAIKFSAEGTRVRVTCGYVARRGSAAPATSGETLAFIRVEDAGSGIAREEADAVFQPFVQAERGRTRTQGERGLG